MNPSGVFNSEVCQRLVLALGHSLWQGVAIAGVAVAAGKLLTRASAQVRYATSLAALMLLAACLPLTFILVEAPPAPAGHAFTRQPDQLRSPAVTQSESTSDAAIDVQPMTAANYVLDHAGADPAGDMDLSAHGPGRTEPGPTKPVIHADSIGNPGITAEPNRWIRLMPWAAGSYVCGVLLMLLRLGASLYGAHRLRKLSAPVDDSRLLAAVARQANRLGLKLAPPMAWCRRVAVPTVAGVIRPVILLPVSFATSLTPDEVDALLAHELAHIRRWDSCVNLCQRLFESVLFFNPAVWFLSRCISTERENCCDDLVVRLGIEPARYAESLVHLAELSSSSWSLPAAATLPATGIRSKLGRRVERLMGIPRAERMSATLGTKSLLVTAVTGVALIAVAVWSAGTHGPAVAVARTAAATDQDDGDPADDSQDLPLHDLAPHAVVGQWIDSVLKNEIRLSWDLTTRGNGIAGHRDLRELWAKDSVRVVRTLRNDRAAMVFTNVVRDNSGRDRAMRFYLQHNDGRWLINRSDFIDAAQLPQLVEGFQAHPGVRFHYRIDDLAGRWVGGMPCFESVCTQLLVLNRDGTFEQRFLSGEHITGTWEIDADTLVIHATVGAGEGMGESDRPPLAVTDLTDDELKVVAVPASGNDQATAASRRPTRYWYCRLAGDNPLPDFTVDEKQLADLPENARRLIGTWHRSSVFAVWNETFLADGRYIHTSNFTAPRIGTWTLEGDRLQVNVDRRGVERDIQRDSPRRIVELTESQVTYEYPAEAFDPALIGPKRFVYQRVKLRADQSQTDQDGAVEGARRGEARDINRTLDGLARREVESFKRSDAVNSNATEASLGRHGVVLENGVRVEVIAIARNPRARNFWWKPDGTPLAAPPGDEMQFTSSPAEDGEHEYAIETRIAAPQGMAIHSSTTRYSPAPRANSGSINFYRDYRVTGSADLLDFDDPPERLSCRIGVAAGPWTRVATLDGRQTTIHDPESRVQFSIAPTSESENGETLRLNVTHRVDPDRFALRILAKLRDGREQRLVFHSGVTRQSPAHGFALAYGLAMDDVSEFVLQRTPWVWGDIEEIALAPDGGFPESAVASPPLHAQIRGTIGVTPKDGYIEGEGTVLSGRFVDLESGTIELPPSVNSGDEANQFAATREFARESGVDVVFIVDDSPQFVGLDLALYPLQGDVQDIDPRRIVRDPILRNSQAGAESYIPLPSKLPANFGFRTREGGFGVLQVLGTEREPAAVRIRYQLAPGPSKTAARDSKSIELTAQRRSPGRSDEPSDASGPAATAMTPRPQVATARQRIRMVVPVFVPRPSQSNDGQSNQKHAALDLASGELLTIEERELEKDASRLTKGDLILTYGHPVVFHPLLAGRKGVLGLFGLREAAVLKWNGDRFGQIPAEQTDVRSIQWYRLGKIDSDSFPIRLMVSTNEGRHFEVRIVSLDEAGATVEYGPAGPAVIPGTSVTFAPVVELTLSVKPDGKRFLTLDDGELHETLPTDRPTVSAGEDAERHVFIEFHNIHNIPLDREEGVRAWRDRTAEQQVHKSAGFFGELPFERHGIHRIRREELPKTIEMTHAGFLQVTEIIDGDSPSLKVRYKLLQAAQDDAGPSAIKRQRFKPAEGMADEASWSVFGSPPDVQAGGWAITARVPLGGHVPVRLPGDENVRCHIELLRGSDQSVTLRVSNAEKTRHVTFTMNRDEPAEASVGGETYCVLYATIRVAADRPDTTPFAYLVIKPADARPSDAVNSDNDTDRGEAANVAPKRGLLPDDDLPDNEVDPDKGVSRPLRADDIERRSDLCFSAVVEAVLPASHGQSQFYQPKLDFESGRVLDCSIAEYAGDGTPASYRIEQLNRAGQIEKYLGLWDAPQVKRWRQDADVVAPVNFQVRGYDCTFHELPTASWETISPQDVVSMLEHSAPNANSAELSPNHDPQPGVFVFRTRDESVGVMRLEASADPAGVKICYRLVQGGAP